MSRKICVYCASSQNVPAVYFDAAAELGAAIAAQGCELVYGGGNVGLMGCLARAVMTNGGAVTGVIPRAMRRREWALESVNRLIETEDMHERKSTMNRLGDGFIALPGGFGTLEEILEAIAHRQLEFHDKPCVLLNVAGFFDPLIAQFERSFAECFARPADRAKYHVVQNVPDALDFLDQQFNNQTASL